MTPLLEGIGKELKRHGVKVKKVPGWKDRGRPYTFDPRAVFEHHTASASTGGNAPSLGIVTNGRVDLPGPLANFVVGRDGTVFLVAGGYCNHGGEGGPLNGIPANSANRDAFGIEIENNGVGESYPADQYHAVVVLTSVLLHRMNLKAHMAIGHKEWTSRKIDPSFDMDGFRERVKAAMKRLWD